MRQPNNSSGSPNYYLSTSSPSVKLSLLGILALLFLVLNASSIVLRKSPSSQQQEFRSQQQHHVNDVDGDGRPLPCAVKTNPTPIILMSLGR